MKSKREPRFVNTDYWSRTKFTWKTSAIPWSPIWRRRKKRRYKHWRCWSSSLLAVGLSVYTPLTRVVISELSSRTSHQSHLTAEQRTKTNTSFVFLPHPRDTIQVQSDFRLPLIFRACCRIRLQNLKLWKKRQLFQNKLKLLIHSSK